MLQSKPTSLTLTCVVEGGVFTVTATSGQRSAVGTGCAEYVAAGNAVKNLVRMFENEKPVEAKTAAPKTAAKPKTAKKVYTVTSGRHEGEKFTCHSTKKTAEGEVWYIGTYEDGSSGRERPRFLEE